VKQFEFTAWKDGIDIPGDTQSLLDLLRVILNWQPHITEAKPILIHCGYVP